MPRKPDIPAEIAEALEELYLNLPRESDARAEFKKQWYRDAKRRYGPRTCKLAMMIFDAQIPKDQVVNYFIDKIEIKTEPIPLPQPETTMPPTNIAPTTLAALPVVITMHGIRTRGAWQKELVPILNDAGYKSVPLDYGCFLAFQMLIPGLRQRKIDWFRDQHEQICVRERVDRPSIIAHSFGTYLVARAMQKYPPVKFDRVILCGAIVQRGYPWSNISANDQVRAVLNDFGRMDFWAGIVAWGVSDAGDSGRKGFQDEAAGVVVQIDHPEFHHGDYFFRGNYKESWIPFLRSEPQRRIHASSKPVTNWRFRIAISILIFMLAVIAYFIIQWLIYRPQKAAEDALLGKIERNHVADRKVVFSDSIDSQFIEKIEVASKKLAMKKYGLFNPISDATTKEGSDSFASFHERIARRSYRKKYEGDKNSDMKIILQIVNTGDGENYTAQEKRICDELPGWLSACFRINSTFTSSPISVEVDEYGRIDPDKLYKDLREITIKTRVPAILAISKRNLGGNGHPYRFATSDQEKFGILSFKSISIEGEESVDLKWRAFAMTAYCFAKTLWIPECHTFKCGLNEKTNTGILFSDDGPFDFCPECLKKIWWICNIEKPEERYGEMINYADLVGELGKPRAYWVKARDVLTDDVASEDQPLQINKERLINPPRL